jgi:hypothetical protein
MAYGGLGLRDLFLELGIAQLKLFIRHIRARTSQGVLLIIRLSWWHLVAGSSTLLLQQPQHPVDYVDFTWYSALQAFLKRIDGSVQIPTDELIHWHPLRVDDVNIMAVVGGLDGVTRADRTAFNRCRRFLGVFYLSEITTADGQCIHRESWRGCRPRFSPLLWPHQPNPGPQSWRV